MSAPGDVDRTVAEGLVTAVVASATPDGTRAAAAAVHRLQLGGVGVDRLRLVLVGDGRGPVPVAVRARVRLLSASVASVHLLPHVHRWRYEDLSSRSPASRYLRAVGELRAAWGLVAPAQPPVVRAAAARPQALALGSVAPDPNRGAQPALPPYPVAGVLPAVPGRRWRRSRPVFDLAAAAQGRW